MPLPLLPLAAVGIGGIALGTGATLALSRQASNIMGVAMLGLAVYMLVKE